MLNFLIPFHPKLVHFPIALFMTAFLFEILGRFLKKDMLSQAAVLIYCFAAALTPVVVYSGLMEAARLNLHHPVLAQHKKFAFLKANFLQIVFESVKSEQFYCELLISKFEPRA